ncbi:MAG: SDR family NAD(P)-dependent oxidoreductase [Bacteroidia bacterium]|nr:SDR family NAD(P)-dependent oxidoreductase [Bacteroidia bacterium]
MIENYVFSGIGHALGKFTITNDDLEAATEKGYLKGFNSDRVRESEAYKEFLKSNPGISPFSFLAEFKMGFKTRNHVAPFPPTKTKLKAAENTLNLAVKAVENALEDSGVHPEEIDAWFMSTATPTEQAPGIASILKCYFVNINNNITCTTVTSACVGFNINIQRAIEYFKCHPDAKHIIIGHSEVMSEIIRRLVDFVPYATFADAAAAIVLSRVHSDKEQGVVSVVNHEDLYMIDFLGANKQGDLYMDAGIVKDRAIINISDVSREALAKSGWNLNEIDLMIPHQTGNAIVHGAAEKMNFPLRKIYQDVQKNHGNLSGASIPLSLSLLKKEKKIKPGMKLLTATAGLGGEFGAYTYIIQDDFYKKTTSALYGKELTGKTALVTGSTGAVGFEICRELAAKGCKLILHYNSHEEKRIALENELKNFKAGYSFFNADFSKPAEVNSLISSVKNSIGEIDYLVHTTGITGPVLKSGDVSDEDSNVVSQVNENAPVEITKQLKHLVKSVVLFIGSVAEDAQFPGSAAYVQSKKGLHGYAVNFSAESAAKGIRTIYYMPGIINSGMGKQLDDKLQYNIMMGINQEEVLDVRDVAYRIVRSLYILKVQKVYDSREASLLVRRDGYFG